jgi:hypothetical protein
MTHPRPDPVWRPSHKIALGAIVLAQFAAAYVIGTEHLLTNDQGLVTAPIAVTAVIPVVAFLAAYGLWPRFRDFVLAQDLRTLTMMQLWRVIGFAFLPLYAVGTLPALFALPAGFGDVAVGLGAFYVTARLSRDAGFATSSGLLGFHLLGLLDFAVAIGTAGLSAGAFPQLIAGEVTSAAMDVWPLNLFPSFIVPAFIILQISALLKIRDLRRAAAQPLSATPQSV